VVTTLSAIRRPLFKMASSAPAEAVAEAPGETLGARASSAPAEAAAVEPGETLAARASSAPAEAAAEEPGETLAARASSEPAEAAAVEPAETLAAGASSAPADAATEELWKALEDFESLLVVEATDEAGEAYEDSEPGTSLFAESGEPENESTESVRNSEFVADDWQRFG